jgi:hypothetical protein
MQALSIVLSIQIQVDSKENTVLLTKMMNAWLERPCCEDIFAMLEPSMADCGLACCVGS